MEIILALIAAVTSVITAWLARGAKNEAKAANNAVNHVGPNEPRLIDIARDLRESVAAIEGQLDVLRQLVVNHISDHHRTGTK